MNQPHKGTRQDLTNLITDMLLDSCPPYLLTPAKEFSKERDTLILVSLMSAMVFSAFGIINREDFMVEYEKRRDRLLNLHREELSGLTDVAVAQSSIHKLKKEILDAIRWKLFGQEDMCPPNLPRDTVQDMIDRRKSLEINIQEMVADFFDHIAQAPA